MDTKLTGIVIRTCDHRENDKKLHILSPDGLVWAVMRGVKKKTAKLRSFAQPFAFAEFEMIKSGNSYTVKTCAGIDDFYGIVTCPDAYLCGCVLLECAEYAVKAVQPDQLFLLLVKSLKILCYEHETPPTLIAAKFLQKVLSLTGFFRAPPPPKNGQTMSAAYAISRCLADQLSGLSLTPAAVTRVLSALIKEFEHIFETQLKSARAL